MAPAAKKRYSKADPRVPKDEPPVPKETYGLGDPSMLERIDKLFACGVGEHVNLPQIVVVGDQSSGKSSVLEGLIRKPLPRDSGLCTRFATMIVFRRKEEASISVSIIPDPNASAEHQSSIGGWSKDDLQTLDSDDFAEIMREVHGVMGLADGDDDPGQKPTFSKDVLLLEICGPDEEHLSVIDVPGIFKNTTQGVTTKADIALVRDMVLGYMENPRSVMLTVIPANVDVATQEILELANDVDPEQDRTLGVLTKPDLVDKGAEAQVVALIEGRKRPMKLGWHVVRNPGQKELDDDSVDRSSLEMNFFRSTAPWDKIDQDKKGVESLRDRLKDVLSSLVRKEFPKVQAEISKKLTAAQKRFKSMGPERSGSAAQTAYLTELSTHFQHLVTVALDAKYGSDGLFDENTSLRIAPLVTARTSRFSDNVATMGQEYHFLKEKKPDAPPPTAPFSVLEVEGEIFNTRELADLDDLGDVLQVDDDLPGSKRDGIEDWLRVIYNTSRGFELGTFDATILATAMKKQSAKWSALSLGYVSDIIVTIHKFITTALGVICSDHHVRDALYSILSEGLVERYIKATKHTEFLLAVERDGTPMTANHYFSDNLDKSRTARVVSSMAPFTIDDCTHGKVVRLTDAMTNHPMSNVDHIVQEIHDILKAYYKVARKRFVDCVAMQAADHFLVNGPDTPLKYFSPLFVGRLSTEELEHIAGEAPRLKRARAQLTKEIASLAEAKKILARG